MLEATMWKVADVAITLFQIGLERDAIVNAIKARQEAGDSPEQVIAYMVATRNAARQHAHDVLAKTV